MTGQKNEIDALLASSLKELTAKKPIEKITIKEITDKAGVIRPTFYNHFQDKYELLEWIINTELLDPCRPLINAGMIVEAMTLLFTNMEKDHLFYSRAVKMEGPVTFHHVAMKCVREMLSEIIAELMAAKKNNTGHLPPELISTYYAQSMCFAAEEWISGGMKIAPRQMAEEYYFLLTHSFLELM